MPQLASGGQECVIRQRHCTAADQDLHPQPLVVAAHVGLALTVSLGPRPGLTTAAELLASNDDVRPRAVGMLRRAEVT